MREAQQIHGHCAPGFEPMRDVFAENFSDGEVGAACCVYLHGEPVVDLWGGLADRETGRPWQRDTTTLMMSSTKGLTAIVVHRLLERGLLVVDAPVARYWPEFAAQGKQGITLRDVLCHRAGLAAVDGDLTLEEVFAWDPVCAAIAAQAPNWEPGTVHGYHVRSYGWILGEVVRRVMGRTLGQVFAEEVAEPLGLDLWIGLPEAEAPRVARLYGPPEDTDAKAIRAREKFMGPGTELGRALNGPSNLFSYGDMWNARALQAAEMPSSNAIGTARSLARCYAATLDPVDGVRLLAPETLVAATVTQVEGPDRIILLPTCFALGFAKVPMLGEACSESAFGHPGAGGSLGFADPRQGLAFGYVMNQMQLGATGDPRAARLAAAAYAGCSRRRLPRARS